MNQIIIAMDMDIGKGFDLMRKTKDSPEIYGYKIGSLWVLEMGIHVLYTFMENLEGTDKKVILDMQKWGTDIPEIVTKQVNRVAHGVHEAIVCPMGGGKESLRAFAEACTVNGVCPVCVLEMTHPESGSYLKDDACLNILHDAIDFGIRRFVIPATKEPRKEIKEIIPSLLATRRDLSEVVVYATGFKVQGGQVKPMVDFGVSKFIVGRAIYEAKDPIEEIKKIYDEING